MSPGSVSAYSGGTYVTTVLIWILIIALGLIALLIVVWAAMELLELLRWTFPANKDDEKGPFK